MGRLVGGGISASTLSRLCSALAITATSLHLVLYRLEILRRNLHMPLPERKPSKQGIGHKRELLN